MFTGIVEEIGTIRRLQDRAGKRYPVIAASTVTGDLHLGDSIACDGVCLTVTAFTAGEFTVEIMRETLLKTTAGHWAVGRRLDLERALPVGGRFGGHIVQGHIDTAARVLQRGEREGTLYLRTALPAEYRDLVVRQGSIALNGVSLTVADLDHDSFTVALIGLTRTHTVLDELSAGDLVNLEFDLVGKYLQRRLEVRSGGLTEHNLREMGF